MYMATDLISYYKLIINNLYKLLFICNFYFGTFG